jgi:aryl-alcohol dehydrogenase-like predicted oxidoreductase
LKSGALTGKYRAGKQAEAGAGKRKWASTALDEHGHEVVELLVQIAKEAGSTPSCVALNWVCRQPGISSPIIGARTLQQLEDNLASLALDLNADQLKRLSDLTAPKLDFPTAFLENIAFYNYPGITINGHTGPENRAAPKPGDKGW